MEREIIASQIHWYMEFKHGLEGLYRNMSGMNVEDYENFSKVEGPAIVYAPHKYSVDFLSIGIAVEGFLRFTYEDRGNEAIWDLATWMARYAGGIKVNNPISFVREAVKALDRGEKVLVFPEGDKNLGKMAVEKAKSDLIIDIPNLYHRRSRRFECPPEVPFIPVGLDYREPPVKIPWRMNIPPPWATHLIVRFGEPVYPSQHPEWNMDDYMRIIARLSNRPYAP